MKKFISAICVIALMMPSTLSAFADAGTADNLSGQQAVVVDVADSTEDAAETETETETESIKESETETISQIESETTSWYTFDENETNASSINTGDRNHGKLWLVIAIIALAGCIAAAVMYVVSKRK